MTKGAGISKRRKRCCSVSPTFCAEILLHILGYSICAKRHILAQSCQMLLPLKASNIICAKAALLWHQKCW
jgi:hypothetical protein